MLKLNRCRLWHVSTLKDRVEHINNLKLIAHDVDYSFVKSLDDSDEERMSKQSSIPFQGAESMSSDSRYNQLLGAVFQEKGRVTFVQNLIVLDLDYSPTKLMLNNLTAVLPELDYILTDPNSQLLLEEKKIWGRIRSDIRQLVAMQSSRPKRSLIPFGGRLLSSVFGTATVEQVNAVNKKVFKIISCAKEKGHLIHRMIQQGNVNSEKIASLNRRINYYAQKANLTGLCISTVNLKLDHVLAAEFTEGLINDVLRVGQGVVLAQ